MAMKATYERVKESKLARNTLWMLLGQGARVPIQAVYFILIARSLGAQGYGAFVAVSALVAILAPFASLGSGNILIKHVARNHSSFQLYWGKAVGLTLLFGTFLVILATVLSKVLLPTAIPVTLVFLIALADLVFSRLQEVSIQAFQAFQRLGRASQLMVLPNVIRLLLLAFLLLFTRNPSPVLWGYFYIAGMVISSVVAIHLVRRELGAPVYRRVVILSELREGLYFSISLSSQNIYNDIDKTMLARMATLEAAGIYGAAYRIIDVSFTPVRSLLYASYARFFKSGTAGIRGTLSFATKLLPFAVGYGLCASLVLFVSAPLLPFFIGNEYSDAVSALRWLSLLPLLKALHYFAADALTGAGYQGTRSICQLVAALLNVGLILWLVPSYSWKGAAWASVATDLALAATMWLLVLRLKKLHAAHVVDDATVATTF